MVHFAPWFLEVTLSGSDEILVRLQRLEHEVATQRRRASLWRIVAVGAVLAVIALPLTTDAAKPWTSIDLRSPDGRAEATFTAQGFEYRLEGQSRVKFYVGDRWDRLTFYRQDTGAPSVSLGTDGKEQWKKSYVDWMILMPLNCSAATVSSNAG